MKKQLINKRGEVVYLDDESNIIPDGYGIRVPAFLMDGVPVTDADTEVRDAHAAMVKRTSNAWRNPNTQHVALMDNDDAREAYVTRMSNAWRTSGVTFGAGFGFESAAVVDRRASASDRGDDYSYEARKTRIENAWRR